MEGSDQSHDDARPLLILGLPDDIALMCLARVPRKYHPVLKCVSKGWREMVCGEMWVSHRRKHNLDETWIYALCRDSINQLCFYVLDPNNVLSPKRWKKIPDFPTCVMKREGVGFEAIGKKVYLLGGCNRSSIKDATDEVYCYDAATNAWSKATSLSVPRCDFLSEVVDGEIYTIGGLVGSEAKDAICWDIYNPGTNKWNKTSHINNVWGGGFISKFNNGDLDHMSSMVFKGKIYLRCSNAISPAGAGGSHVMMIAYDPLHKTWQEEEDDDDDAVAGGWLGPTVVIGGTLYVLDQSSCGGTKVVMWKEEEEEVKEWIPIGRLSPLLTQPPCELVAIGTNLFIVGKGLGTVIFDIEKAKRTKGVIVTSSIPRLCNYDLDVISCKCVTI